MGVNASLVALDTQAQRSLRENPEQLVPFLTDRSSPLTKVDLAGHWEILTFAISGKVQGSENPLDLVERDFPTFVEVDLGYGPPRLISNADLESFATVIATVSNNDIYNRLNESDLTAAGIYEKEAILKDRKAWGEALIAKADELRAFAAHCSDTGSAAMVYFS